MTDEFGLRDEMPTSTDAEIRRELVAVYTVIVIQTLTGVAAAISATGGKTIHLRSPQPLSPFARAMCALTATLSAANVAMAIPVIAEKHRAQRAI